MHSKTIITPRVIIPDDTYIETVHANVATVAAHLTGFVVYFGELVPTPTRQELSDEISPSGFPYCNVPCKVAVAMPPENIPGLIVALRDQYAQWKADPREADWAQVEAQVEAMPVSPEMLERIAKDAKAADENR